MKKINPDQLIAIIGKEKADSLFLDPKWIKKQQKYKVADIRYIIWEQFGRLEDLDGDEYTGDLNLSGKSPSILKYLPKIKILNGDFNCSTNELTHLENCPDIVNGRFMCQYNLLTSLEGCPKSVKSSFYCYDNPLTDLKGSPKYVGGDFNCGFCENLKSLDGISEEIVGDFLSLNNNLNTQRTPDGKTYRLVSK